MGKNIYQAAADQAFANAQARANAVVIGQTVGSLADLAGQYAARRKQDRIANELMADQDVRKATPVLDASGQRIIHGGDHSAAGERVYNAALGVDNDAILRNYHPAPTPDRGGMAGLDLRMRQALIKRKLAEPAAKVARPDPHTYSTPFGMMTPSEGANFERANVRDLARGPGGSGALHAPVIQPKADTPQALDYFSKSATGGMTRADFDKSSNAGRFHFDQSGRVWEGDYTPGATHLFGPNDAPKPNVKHSFSYDAYQQIMDRGREQDQGTPRVLNQSVMDTYGVGGSSGGAYPGRLNVTPTPGRASAAPPDAQQQATAIKAQVRAGTLKREDAMAQLQALGFN